MFEEAVGPIPVQYAQFAPKLATLPNGNVIIDNLYSRTTGESPVILPGMTPTTVDAPIVVAGANAGFTSELAGGGPGDGNHVPAARGVGRNLEARC